MTIIDDLLTAEGPIASIYLRAPSAMSDAGHRLETRWKNARRQLAAADAPNGLLEQLDDTIAGVGHEEAPAFAMFAGDGAQPIVEPLDDPLADDVVAYDRVPHLIPVIHSHQRSLPHVMVTTDRTGADIVAVVDGHETESETVDGSDLHIHRGRFGGWSHRRIQQRAENHWEDNARDVAARLEEIARQVGARVVTVAGDVRATQFLMEHLDDDVRSITTVLDVGDPEAIADQTVTLVADAVARETRSLLEQHADRVSAGTAVAGVDAVFDALSAGRVDTLLVVDEVEDERRAYFPPDGSPVCSPTRTSDEMIEGRLVDVAVRSGLLADADVRVVPHTVLDDDIGALLRW